MIEKDYENESKLIQIYKKTRDEKALWTLVDEYQPLINSLTSLANLKFKSVPLDENDFRQLLVNGIRVNILNYDEDRGKRFASYNKQQLWFMLTNHVKKFMTNAHKAMNFSYETEEERTIEREFSPDIFETEEREWKISFLHRVSLSGKLSNRESQLLRMQLKGLSIKEITSILGLSRQAVHHTKKSLQQKLKRLLN